MSNTQKCGLEMADIHCSVAEIDDLKAQIAKLQSDNSQLVEQMNAMTIKYESLEQHCIALEEDINMWQASGAWKTGKKGETMNDILQTICPECGHECWRKANDDDYIYCPECGAKLNEYSSEDADSGIFTDINEKDGEQ